MTTTITENEIKLIYIEIILVAIIGTFLFFYINAPVPVTKLDHVTAVSTEPMESSWISSLVSPTLGLPVGVSEIIIVSSIFLVPLTIMNVFVAIRYVKDMATGWV